MNNTYKNHLKYYIDDRLFGYRQQVFETYRVEVGKIDLDHYKSSNFLKEQSRTALLVLHDLGKDLQVMFSGGTDSEAVVLAFLKIGFVPKCTFIYFKGDYNKQDYLEAKRICDKFGIDLEIFDFDIVDFYRSGEAADMASEVQCRQLAYLSVMNAVKTIGRPSVMGGEFFMKRSVYPDRSSQWYYCYRENEDASSIRFSHRYNIPIVNDWFCYTPEMMGYFLENSKTKQLINNKFNYKLSSVSSKNEILVDLIPDLTLKKKTHGFENLGGLNIEAYYQLKKTHLRRLEKCLDGIYLNDLIKMLGIGNNDNIKIGFDTSR